MKKRFLSLLCVLALCLGLLPVTALAEGPEGVWTGYVASGFAGGTGTEDDPYQIATAEQLAKLSNDVSVGTSYQGTFFVLTENIDLSAHRWTPIGIYKWEENGTTINNSFQGFLDGNNKTISGMYVDERTDQYCGGLFGKINIQKNGSPVGAKDLTITGATVYVDETGLNECSGAILAGNVMGSDTQSVVFENITVSGSVHVTRTNGYNNIGGMLGYASWVKATNCHADGVSITGASNCGGFVGNDSGSVYENCTASGTMDGSWVLGGFVGYSASAIWQDSAGASTYTKCAADVDVSGNNWELGGFVGLAGYGVFNNCVAYGDVTSSVTGWEPKVGGFMGECGGDPNDPTNSYANATDCHAAGTVTGVSSDYQAGGFIGTYSGGTFTGCSFDSEKNPDLNAAGEGTIASGITGEESAVVLSNICEDYYGGHQFSDKWAVDTAATCTEAGSKYHPCERCGAKKDITEIPATGHSYGEPEWNWSEDGKTCTVTFTCQNDASHKENPKVTVTSEVKTPATSTQKGVTKYTATTKFAETTYTDTKEVADIPATGHSSGGSSTSTEYNLRFDTNGGDAMSTIVKQANTAIDLDKYVPTRDGYKFVGWYADEDLTKPIDEITLTQSTTIYAKWEKIEEEEQEETTEQEETAVSFTDVRESDWFYKAVSYAVEHGLMSGMGDGTFSPNTPLQREMFATVLWNLEGNPAPKDVAPFLDVTSDKYYADAIAWASENGIVAGFGDTFGVGVPITREQFAVMLHNYAQYKGYDVSVGEDTNILSYADAFDISDYAYPAMQWACGAGIINGMGDGTLAPQGQTTRAEAATMLMNFCENVVK